MKTISRNDFVEIGSVVKIHGTKGELKVVLTRKINFKEWAFLQIRGKPVPFYIQQCKHNYEEEAFLKLEGIDQMDIASILVGYALLAPSAGLKKPEQKLDDSFLNYKIIDSKQGELGIVEALLEMPMQLLIKTTYRKQELLIPAINPILMEIDDEHKIIYVEMPDGLLEI
ncbi:MAG: hypothetical protein H7296_15465 [Bacteroidia bacterium]|nr:hypothetical protein [Bacteroidia bacterium]